MLKGFSVLTAAATVLTFGANASAAFAAEGVNLTTQVTTSAGGSATFECSGEGYRIFTVPERVDSLHIQAWGASGESKSKVKGGNGAYASGNISVTPGQKLKVITGCVRGGGTLQYSYGFGNGGYGGKGLNYHGGWGGGASAVMQEGSNIDSSVLLVAGGGGGAGASGSNDTNSGTNGKGGAGGDAGKVPGNGSDSATGARGGKGGGAKTHNGTNAKDSGSIYSGGGGGGGGYSRGGGAGALDNKGAGGGGAGQSFIKEGVVYSSEITTSSTSGNGRIEVSWAPEPPQPPPIAGTQMLSNVSGGGCITASDSQSDGSLHLQTCDEASAQQKWDVRKSDSTIRLVYVKNGVEECLTGDEDKQPSFNGAAVLKQCDAKNTAQQWSTTDVSQGKEIFKNERESNMALAVERPAEGGLVKTSFTPAVWQVIGDDKK
ncbi:ricin-type beta-trefoil lectin domain protein [Streptomyces sp. 1222.5]|uniref:ricin-type beta-trefoil lectin domain protein n=1 Tax=Streptomyces sp. 1222.5 TaxID=1881026 RepID=UPI003EB97B0F